MQRNLILSPKEGYNLIAPFYDSWKWQEFWRYNEYPFIERWCDRLEVGYGADLGAGSGNNLDCFLKRYHHVTAYDISEMMSMICRQKYEQQIACGLLECIEKDIRELSVNQRQYDWLLCNRVLSHIYDIDNVIRRMAHILKKGGECFISDVHPLHHYEHTHYRIGDRNIIISTYKHGIEDLRSCFYMNGLSIIEFKEIAKPDLIAPALAERFHSIKDDTTPIFYYMVLRKL